MLLLGTHKTDAFLNTLPESFLLIDDGALINRLPRNPEHLRLDFSRHRFNPLKGMNYLRARQFIQIINAVFPEGENTLTKKNSTFILLNALLSNPQTLDTLIPKPDNPKDSAALDAYQKIQTILLSPFLRKTFCPPRKAMFDRTFPLTGTLIARLDRAKIGDFDAFLLAQLLISQYPGTVVIPDFGFYGRDHHLPLIRQDRLIAGLYTLSQVPDPLRQQLLLGTMEGHGCTYDDACTLADYAGIPRQINRYADFVAARMK